MPDESPTEPADETAAHEATGDTKDLSNGVSLRLDGDVAVITIDDDKANALTYGLLGALDAALDIAFAEAKAVAIIGREHRFSGGFDLAVMTSGPAEANALFRVGSSLGHKIFLAPIPVVLGCTGHAVAMGAILLMCADLRIGAGGPYKIGLVEVAIGMALPQFAVSLARHRLSTRHLTEAVNHARMYAPVDAVEAGYLDRVVPLAEVGAAAVAAAQELADRLHPEPFRITRRFLRGEEGERLLAFLDPVGDAFAPTEG
jgi:enoyl-CoA hydratase